jgi:Phosphodiester glycosidase
LLSIRVTVILALVGAATLSALPAAAATTPRIRGPIVSYRCPPVPLWCSKRLRRGIGGWPGVTITHLRAKMRTGPTQDIYRLSWKLGDPHVRLSAQALNPASATGSIRLGTISHWAAGGAPAGFVGAINGDFFAQAWSSWRTNTGTPSGLLVESRRVVHFASGSPGVGYEANGRMVMGMPTAKPAKLLLRGGRTATIGGFDLATSGLDGVKGDQVVVETTRTAPVDVPGEWSGYLVGSATQPAPFATMLRGMKTMANSTGNGRQETVAGFRFGDGGSVVATVTLPIVPVQSSSVQLGPGQVLVIAKQGLFADQDLSILAANSQRISVTVDARGWAAVQDVMGGKPQLVQNGKVTYPKAHFDPPVMSSDGWQWEYPHWRPAVAETSTHGWLIITGGVHYRDGVVGWNWGKMLVQLGARNAMGFDNNSSTELDVLRTGRWTFSPGWEREITEATALAYH